MFEHLSKISTAMLQMRKIIICVMSYSAINISMGSIGSLTTLTASGTELREQVLPREIGHIIR